MEKFDTEIRDGEPFKVEYIFGTEILEGKSYTVEYVNYANNRIENCLCSGKDLIDLVREGKPIELIDGSKGNIFKMKKEDIVVDNYIEFADITGVKEFSLIKMFERKM